MNKMLRYLSDYKRESVLAPLFKMLEATFDLFVPLVMADIVNVGIAAHDFHYILVRCGILLLLAIVGLTCSLTAQYFSAKAAVGYSTGLRHALFEHIQTLSFSEMDTMGTSTLITRMTSDVNQVQSGLNLFLRLFLRSPFVVLGAMIMAFTVNFRAALIFVVAIPLLSVVVFGVMVITRPLYKSVQTRLDRVLGLTRENLTGVRVVRAFDKEKSEVDRFEDANELLTKMQLHVGHISALMNPLTYVIINLAIVALLYVGSIEINIGGMASGDVIALVNYMNQILVELVKLANLIVQVSKALACAGRVQAVLDTKPGMEFPAQLTGNVPAEKAGDAVRFDHVSLTYKGAGAPSLSDISFTAKRGQTIGVIGVPAHKVRADSGIPLMKPLHRAGEILDRVGLRRPDRDAAGIEVIQGPELLLSLIDERQDILGPLSEKHAGVGEPDTVIRSLVQLPPELFLEVLQLFGKRRLGHKQPLSRPRHIAFAGYCHEVAKHPDFHCGLLWTVMPFVSRHPFEKIINLSGSCHRPRL